MSTPWVKKKADWLEVENAKLKEETDAVAAAAQAIGKSLRGRVKELEATQHHLQQPMQLQQQQLQQRRRFSEEQIRDGFFFLAGVLSGVVVCSLINGLKKTTLLFASKLDFAPPSLFRPDIADISVRRAGFAQLVLRHGLGDSIFPWLARLSPLSARIRRLEDELEYHANDFRVIREEAGDLIDEAENPYYWPFLRVQQASDWLFAALLGEEEPDVWAICMKAHVFTKILQHRTGRGGNYGELCDSLSHSGEYPVLREYVCRATARETTEPGNFGASELHLLGQLEQLEASDVKRVDGRAALQVAQALLEGKTKEYANREVLRFVRTEVPMEIDPLGKYLCLKLRINAVCMDVARKAEKLAESGTKQDLIRVRKFYEQIGKTWYGDCVESWMERTVPVPLEFGHPSLEFSLKKEFGVFRRPVILRFFQILSLLEKELHWPGLRRVLRAQTVAELQGEFELVTSRIIPRFMAAWNMASGGSSAVETALEEIPARDVREMRFAAAVKQPAPPL